MVKSFVIDHLTNSISYCVVNKTKSDELSEVFTTGCPDILLGSDYCYELNVKCLRITFKEFHLFDSEIGYMQAFFQVVKIRISLFHNKHCQKSTLRNFTL